MTCQGEAQKGMHPVCSCDSFIRNSGNQEGWSCAPTMRLIVAHVPAFLVNNLDILSHRTRTGAFDSVDAYGDAYGRRQDDYSS
jgi:hypothetical protein